MTDLMQGDTLPEPSYLALWKKGILQKRARDLTKTLASCELCPRHCRVNRLHGEMGICGAGKFPTLSSYGPHFGEEPPLVGDAGSGTVFFTYCCEG